jgi:cell division protein FtsL
MVALLRPARAFPRSFVRRNPSHLLLAIAVATAIGAAVFHVNQLSRATTAGYEIDALQRLRSAKQAENHELEAEVASLSSLARVDWEARTQLGLQPARQTLHLSVNHPVPERQMLPGRYAPPEAPLVEQEEPSTPLWRRVLQLLPFY